MIKNEEFVWKGPYNDPSHSPTSTVCLSLAIGFYDQWSQGEYGESEEAS